MVQMNYNNKNEVKHLPHYLVKKIKNKRLIFTISTGRSGTGYLARILNLLPGVNAKHEPEPKFSNLLRKVQTKPELALHFWILQKLPAIALLKEKIYIETSHVFGKGFLEPLIKLEIIPDIIILKRDYRKVASSLYNLNTIPGRTLEGLNFLLNPDDPYTNSPQNWRQLNDYQLCYWYCLEMNRRMKIYEELILENRGKVIHAENIFKRSSFKNLIQQLEIDPINNNFWGDYNKIYQQKVNSKIKQKNTNRTKTLGDLDILENQVCNRLEFCKV